MDAARIRVEKLMPGHVLKVLIVYPLPPRPRRPPTLKTQDPGAKERRIFGLATLAQGRRGGGSLRSHATAAEIRAARRFAPCHDLNAAQWQGALQFRKARTAVSSAFGVLECGRWQRAPFARSSRTLSPLPETTRPHGGHGAAFCHWALSG